MAEFYNGRYIDDNGILRVEVNPMNGGNISSIKYKGKELLFQPPRHDYDLPERGSSFEKYAAAGFDDAFPNIDAEEIIYGGKRVKYNDHGDVWTAVMEIYLKNGGVVLHTTNERYFFEKAVRVDKNRLTVSYRIKNMSDDVFPCFYTMHCLFECEENMRVIFPENTTKVENALDSERLGQSGTVHNFPVTESGADLSHIRSKNSRKYEKFYAYNPLSEGKCAICFPQKGVTAKIEWDKAVLPYLGFWVTEGGFRSDYNCALEPSSGYYDSVSRALKNNRLWLLRPDEEKRFDISISVQEEAK